MKEKVSRRLSSLVYLNRRIYRRLANLRPSLTIVAIFLISASIFLLGGGIYDIIMKPLAILPMRGRLIYYYPYYIHEQFLNESIAVMILYTIGILGFFLIYQSTRYARNLRQATMLLAVGITFLAISYIIIEAIIFGKIYFSAG